MLSQFIVRTADLLEAEGRIAKQGVYRLAAAIAGVIVAAALLVAALLLLTSAGFLALLAAGMPAWLVCLLLGLGLLIIGTTGVVIARFLGMGRR
jgi:hypothetical protein